MEVSVTFKPLIYVATIWPNIFFFIIILNKYHLNFSKYPVHSSVQTAI